MRPRGPTGEPPSSNRSPTLGCPLDRNPGQRPGDRSKDVIDALPRRGHRYRGHEGDEADQKRVLEQILPVSGEFVDR